MDNLIIFIQKNVLPVGGYFQKEILPEIEKICKEMNVAIHVKDAINGVPEEVTITPLLVFQNSRGRSIYQGRTNTLERVRNFIRTSRFIPQGKTGNVRNNIPIWKYEKTNVWAPLKITPATGTIPANFDESVFHKEAIAAIQKGFIHFSMEKEIELGRSDRGFYMDFHPWISKDGTLFLSLALYSQFHCKEPVFIQKGDSLAGPWDKRGEVFKRAAAIMEQQVKRVIADPSGGDGFDPIASTVKSVTWKELGFPMQKILKTQKSKINASVTLSQNWELTPNGENDPPLVQFRFPAPLDGYSGQVTKGAGEITFLKDLLPQNASGFIEVDPTSITMGESSLDKELLSSMFLNTKKFPIAKFAVQSVTSEPVPIAFGSLSTGTVKGTFTMKGKSMPISLPVDLEPALTDENKVRLILTGAFQIHLPDFTIEGADGPEPQRNTLLLNLYMKFKSAN